MVCRPEEWKERGELLIMFSEEYLDAIKIMLMSGVDLVDCFELCKEVAKLTTTTPVMDVKEASIAISKVILEIGESGISASKAGDRLRKSITNNTTTVLTVIFLIGLCLN